MARNEVVIVIRGEDKLSGTLKGIGGSLSGLNSSAGSSTSAIGKLGGALGNMATVAGGIVAANIFGKIADGIGAFVAEGFRAVGASQALEVRLNSLFTAQLMYEQQTTTTTQAIMKSAEAIAREEEQMAANLTKRELLNAKIQEQRERVRQMTEVWTDEGLATETARAKLADMERQLSQLDGEIAKGTSGIKEYATITKTNWVPSTLSAAEIQKRAQEQTSKLTKNIEDLAKKSPFPTEKIKEAAAFAVQMGLNADEAADLTRAMTNMGAAMALPGEEVVFLINNLKQMQATQRLNVIDMREMSRRGIDLAKVLSVEMGMSVDEFNEKIKDSPELFDELIDGIIHFSDNTFGSTVDQMARTLPGMLSNLQDVVSFAARDFLLPLVDAVQPVAQMILDNFDTFLVANMSNIGEGIVDVLKATLGLITGDDLAIIDLIKGLSNFGIDPSVVAQIALIADTVQETIERIRGAFQEGGLAGVIAEVGTMLTEAWETTILPALLVWRDNFFGWVAELYPRIPTMLTTLVDNISTFLSDNWPTIQEKLAEWSEKFWEWVTEAASGAGAAMTAIIVAIGDWATGPEGGEKLTTLGTQLGEMLVDGLSLSAENTDRMGEVITKIVGGLALGVGAAGGLLIVIGGQIVAGILAGILEKMGIDIEPATFAELSGILKGIASNALTAAKIIGTNILLGISKGILDSISKITTTLEQIGEIITIKFKELFGISSPSTIFAGFGMNLIKGLIEGLKSVDLVGALSDIFSGVMDTIGRLLGGGGDGAGATLFDAAAILPGVTEVQTAILNLTTLTTNYATLLTTLQQLFVTVTTSMVTQLLLVFDALMLVQTLKMLMIETTLPLLMQTSITTTTTMVAGFQTVIQIVQQLIMKILALTQAFIRMGQEAVKAADQISKALRKIAEDGRKSIAVIDEMTTAFGKLAAAANRAANAARNAANASRSGGAGGARAHGGPVMGGQTYLVGERGPELFTPSQAGFIVPNDRLAIGDKTTTNNVQNNYNLTINTNAPSENLAADFAFLRALGSSQA